MIKFLQAQKGKDKKYKGWSDKLAKISDDTKNMLMTTLFKKQMLKRKVIFYTWFNMK